MWIKKKYIIFRDYLKRDTWSVGNSVKSSGGFVITYRLEEASHDELVSRNLENSRWMSENEKSGSSEEHELDYIHQV